MVVIRRTIFSVVFVLVLTSGMSYGKDIPLMQLEAVTDLIMSPGCSYIYTLTNCPSAEAVQMREIVKDKLSNGESKDEILTYFEDIYGPRVLAQPKKKGFYFVAWWFPYFLIFDVFVLVGLIIYVWRKRGSAQSEASVTGISGSGVESDEDISRIIEEEVRKFRSE